MIVNIWDFLVEISEKLEKFMVTNYDEPFLWIGIFVGLIVLAFYGISSLANK